MVMLHTSGSYFGLPDPSPFVVKAMMLLKMSGVPFEIQPMSFGKAPKGKVPYIRDGDLLLGDSHFIGKHLERNHGVDFSGGYSPEDLAKGWAVARMLEEHLYFLLVWDRWMDDENFNNGPREYFNIAPSPVRPIVRAIVRRKVRKMLHAQGLGRHTETERVELGKGDIDAVSSLLGSNRFLLGPRISEADATVYAFLSSTACSIFKHPLVEIIRTNGKLMDYLKNIQSQYFPEFPV